MSSVDMETIVSLCKRRGFIFQSSEIYGGAGGCWDYGPLGVELKRNVKEAWWQAMVHDRDDMVGIDASILMHPQVWVASGHVQQFSDPLVDCKSCKKRFRADHRQGEQVPRLRRRADRAPHVQPDVQDLHGTGGGRRGGGLPAAGDGPGHLRQLPERAEHLAPEAALRHRPDGQVLPQRDHHRQLHLPQPRVRADGDGVLRQAGHRRPVVRVLAGAAVQLVRQARHQEGEPAPAPACEGRAGPLRQGLLRRRVPLPHGLVGAGGHRQPRRLST